MVLIAVNCPSRGCGFWQIKNADPDFTYTYEEIKSLVKGKVVKKIERVTI